MNVTNSSPGSKSVISEPVTRHVLLVEDNAPNVMVATGMLEAFGYTYLVAANGPEGIEKFKAGQFQLVLMDIQMPLLSGIETTQQIRQIEQQRGSGRTPIVAMTAYIAKANMNKCMDAGMDDIIPKPFHPDYFSKMLSRYIKTAA